MKPINRRTVLAGLAGASMSSFASFHTAFAEDGFIELTARATRFKLKGQGAPDSDLIGYDGQIPGPTLRFTQGEVVRIRVRNELDVPTTVHWHGIRLENAMDGVPQLTQEAIPPNGTFDYEFVPPDAGTFWYHSHVDGWSQVSRGLFGALIIDEVKPAFATEHDHILVLTDWRLTDSGVLDAASLGKSLEWAGDGHVGNLVTVNGVEKPEITLPANTPQRLRLINTSTAKILKLELAASKVQIIARDGQTLATPREVSGDILLGPAQRVDLMAEFAPDVPAELNGFGGEALAHFKTTRPGTDQSRPELVPANLDVPDMSTIRWVPLLMEGGDGTKPIHPQIAHMQGMNMNDAPPLWAFNNVAGMGDKPLFEAASGESIGIEMINKTQHFHAIHVHGHDFRIIPKDGPPPQTITWYDTVVIAPNEVMRIAFVTGKVGKWMIHCHILEHSVSGMDTWFRVT